MSHYYPEINYLRGFSILAVISIHVSGYFTKMHAINLLTLLYMVIDSISHFAVPAFVFISGFVLYNKYNSNFDIKQFYIKRFKTIIPSYIIFSTFYIIFKFVGSKVINETVDTNIIHMYLTGTSLYHMWFFILIIQLYLLYPLISKIYDFSNVNALLLTFILGVLFSTYRLPSQLFYFVFGIYLNTHYRTPPFLRHYYFAPFVLVVGTLVQVFDYSNMYFSYTFYKEEIISNAILIIYFTVLFTIFLDISIYLSKLNKLKCIDRLGSYSFAIYLIHAAFIYVLAGIFSKLGYNSNNIFFYPVMLVITLGLSIISVKIIQRMPGSDYIIGRIG